MVVDSVVIVVGDDIVVGDEPEHTQKYIYILIIIVY